MLLLDVGNTRIKWAQAQGGRLGEVHASLHGGDPLACLDQLPRKAGQVRVACVFGADRNEILASALAAHCRAPVRVAAVLPECDGLRIAYRDPTRLGVDRWLAMLGAWRSLRGPLCIVSAGTALTFDAVDGRGRHLGGLIAPGLDAMTGAVLTRTRFPAGELPRPCAPALGRDTESCVAQGALHAAIGLIRAASRGRRGARWICGGDAQRLLPGLGERWLHRPHAVLEGLLALPDAAVRASRGESP